MKGMCCFLQKHHSRDTEGCGCTDHGTHIAGILKGNQQVAARIFQRAVKVGKGLSSHDQQGMFCAESVHLVKKIRAEAVSGDDVRSGKIRGLVPAGEKDTGTSVRKFPQDFPNLFRTRQKRPLALPDLTGTFKA
jgi:hypothetical protein